MIDYKAALWAIPCSAQDDPRWLKIMMAAKDAGLTFEDVDLWNQTDPERYDEAGNRRRWESIGPGEVTKDSLVFEARKYGFEPLDSLKSDPTGEAVAYLRALFHPGEYANYVIKSRESGGKYTPENDGVYKRTALETIKKIEADGVEQAFMGYDKQAGGWIRINPVDGAGVSDVNVVDFRHVLVESDTMPRKKQLALIEELKLPSAAIVDSGGKSIHAVVKIGAKDRKEFDARVEFLFKTLEDYGLEVDTANKNPARLSRMPGLKRGDTYQRLIATDAGLGSYEEWKAFIEGEKLEVESYAQMIESKPKKKPELIEGILRHQHKMIVTGPSKAGKTQLLVEAAVAVAEGQEWLGCACEKGKVLYINLEIDRDSFYYRVHDCYEGFNWEERETENLHIANLRGKAEPLKSLSQKIINYSEVRGHPYDLIVLDPTYKIQSGDENSAGDISTHTNEIDRLGRECSAAVIYSHHHSKGQQGFKSSIDRGSGSGVFARDADAIVDVLEIESDNEYPAFRCEFTLREFAPIEPTEIYYKYPVHVVDTEGNLKFAKPKGQDKPHGREKEDPNDVIDIMFESLADGKDFCMWSDFKAAFPFIKNEGTLRNKLSTYNGSDRDYIYKVKKPILMRELSEESS